jgi:hypothetical protein
MRMRTAFNIFVATRIDKSLHSNLVGYVSASSRGGGCKRVARSWSSGGRGAAGGLKRQCVCSARQILSNPCSPQRRRWRPGSCNGGLKSWSNLAAGGCRTCNTQEGQSRRVCTRGEGRSIRGRVRRWTHRKAPDRSLPRAVSLPSSSGAEGSREEWPSTARLVAGVCTEERVH